MGGLRAWAVTAALAVVTTAAGTAETVAAPAAAGADALVSSAATAAVTSRIAGRDRIETAVAISQRAFAARFTTAGSVYLARADVLVDAVAAGTLVDGPVLLVPSCGRVPRVVLDEVARLGPARVVGIGSAGAVCDQVVRDAAAGRPRTRLAGPDRYGTAIEVARERARQGAVTEVYLATGEDSPDPVVGGQLTRGPILLTSPRSDVTERVRSAVEELRPQRVVALGSTAVVPDHPLEAVAGRVPVGRLGGGDRFGTAAAIAGREFPADAPVVYLARGDVYADAVAAGALRDGPLLLVNTCALPAAARERIAYARPAAVIALGGTSVVCDEVLQAATRATTVSGGRNLAVDQDRTGWSSNKDFKDGFAMSGDGRFVLFRGDASALLPPGSVPAGTSRALLLRDRRTGTLELVSVTSAGTPFSSQTGSAAADRTSVSDDGRYVAFTTDQPDPGLGDGNEGGDVYLRDRVLGTTRLVTAVGGRAVSGTWGQISRDGRYVFFHSTAPFTDGEADRVADVFRYSVADGTVERVSANAAGEGGNGGSYVASPSSDGRYVAFQSVATNLVDGDSNGKSDVFVKDMQTGAVVRASVSDGQQGDGSSSIPSLSGDGSRLVFLSKATNFGAAPSFHDQVHLWQRGTGRLTWVSRTPSGAAFTQPNIAHISGDGSTIVFDAYTGADYQSADPRVWRYEVATANLSTISTTYAGGSSPSSFASLALSQDGRSVVFAGAFATSATNLMAVVVWES